jgi:serine protease AprX
VIAVGAADPMDTDLRADDTVTSFTNHGNATRHPDVLASGRLIVSLRAPGSYIDRIHPTADCPPPPTRSSACSAARPGCRPPRPPPRRQFVKAVQSGQPDAVEGV